MLEVPKWRERGSLKENQIARLLLDVGVPPRYHSGDLLRDFPDFDFQKDKSYLLTGETGVGKTHMLCAMVKELLIVKSFPKAKCLYIVFNDMIRKLKEDQFTKPRKLEYEDDEPVLSYLDELRAIQVLAIDDFATSKLTDWETSQTFDVINHRYNHLLPTYLSSNLSLADMPGIVDGRIISRLAHDCKVVTF
jgi:DNA replication protein DnaC